ncbi:Uncharacterised protein [Mycobacteroides abscessus subsp. abscessus]|nr:Uncharacterised protein [Mycobacteroides abscessus subsp. abscessus]
MSINVYQCDASNPHDTAHGHDTPIGTTAMHVTLHGRTEFTEHPNVTSAMARLADILIASNTRAQRRSRDVRAGELFYYAPGRSYHNTRAGEWSIHNNEGN